MSSDGARAQLALGQSALDQIILRQSKHYNDREAEELKEKIEKACVRFDKRGKGRLGLEELYNVLKLQNRLECHKDQLGALIDELDKDKDGRVEIAAFVHRPIISRAVFDSIDRNRDGRVSKGELKLAAKGMSMKELVDIINQIDKDNDGLLSFDEVKAVSRKAFDKWNKNASSVRTSTFSEVDKKKSSGDKDRHSKTSTSKSSSKSSKASSSSKSSGSKKK